MKEIILLVLAGCGAAITAMPCCPNNETLLPKAYCGAVKMTALNCPHRRLLLWDIILDGTKVSKRRSPGVVLVEDPNEYCLGEMYRNNSDHSLGTVPVAVACFDEISWTFTIKTNGVLALISVFFLVATIAVYTFLPQLRDLQGLCYMSMCVSMSFGYLGLGVTLQTAGFKDEICNVIGFIVYTWMMATFFWMNVICINIYRTVLNATYLKKTEKKQYFYYSCYAWGCTLLFLTVALIANFVEGDHFKPGFGNGRSWFNGRTETWIFFYGPVAVLIASNVALFILSSYTLWRHTRKYEVNTLNSLKYKFLISLKLFLVMGISWIFEIANYAWPGEAKILWKITDIFNGLQGVIIFLLLVIFRRRAMRGLASKNICLCCTRCLAEKLSPHDDTDDQHILADDTIVVDIRLN